MDIKQQIKKHKQIMKRYQRAASNSIYRQILAIREGHAGKTDQDMIDHYDRHAKQLAILIAYEQSQI